MKGEIRLNVHTARYRGEVREVFTLREPPRHLYIGGEGSTTSWICADAGGFNALARLATLAGRNPQRAFFFGHGDSRPMDKPWLHNVRSFDLLLVHQRFGLRVAHWSDLRRQLDKGRPCRLPFRAVPEDFDPLVAHAPNGGRGVWAENYAETFVVSSDTDGLFALAQGWQEMAGYPGGDETFSRFYLAATRDYRRERFSLYDTVSHAWQEGPPYYYEVDFDLNRWPGITVAELKARAAESGGEFITRKGSIIRFRWPLADGERIADAAQARAFGSLNDIR